MIQQKNLQKQIKTTAQDPDTLENLEIFSNVNIWNSVFGINFSKHVKNQ